MTFEQLVYGRILAHIKLRFQGVLDISRNAAARCGGVAELVGMGRPAQRVARSFWPAQRSTCFILIGVMWRVADELCRGQCSTVNRSSLVQKKKPRFLEAS